MTVLVVQVRNIKTAAAEDKKSGQLTDDSGQLVRFYFYFSKNFINCPLSIIHSTLKKGVASSDNTNWGSIKRITCIKK